MKKVIQECGLPASPTLKVQSDQCSTCIFKPDSSLNLRKLLDDVRDFTVPGFLFFKGYRICHYSEEAVCAGFWRQYKDKFALGQIAQRLGRVEYVHHTGDEDDMSNKSRAKREARLARQRAPERLYTANLAQQARALYRPEENGGLTEAEMRDAIAAANGRLEAKQHPLQFGPGGTKPVDPQWAAMRNVRARSKAVSSTSERRVVVPDPVIVIPEAEFVAAMEEARAAGRSTLDVPTLAALLAQPTPFNYRDQKGYAKERLG